MTHTGVIDHWYGRYGMGFIRCKTVPKGDVWIHYSTAPRGVRYRRGTEVEFDVVATARGYQAANVRVIGENKPVKEETRADRERREKAEAEGFDPVAWETATGQVSPWHFIDPLFPEFTLCNLKIPLDRVVEGGPYPRNCKTCQGRASRRQRGDRDAK